MGKSFNISRVATAVIWLLDTLEAEGSGHPDTLRLIDAARRLLTELERYYGNNS
jgi:hypothetical protein